MQAPQPVDPLVCYDIGARGRLQDPWHDYAMLGDLRFTFVLLEPDPAAAAELRQLYQGKTNVQVIEEAAYHSAGVFDLYVARHGTCSSLLRPNFDVLQRYNIAPIFETVRTTKVICNRLDEIIASKNLPKPDFIKMDVQGAEHAVLLGMGRLLSDCLAIEMETHTYPIYKGQKTLGQMVDFLYEFDLILCQLSPQRHFEYDFVEANAIYCRHESSSMSQSDKDKISVIRTACGIEFHPQGTWIKQSL